MIWNEKLKTKNNNACHWPALYAEGLDFRNNIIRFFSLAFRKDKDTLTLLKSIRKRRKRSEVIQSFLTLSIAAREKQETLAACNFDFSLLDKLEVWESILSDMAVKAKGDKRVRTTFFDFFYLFS
ncbi:MAG: hypothetical protein GY765_43865 [bacterium]|nr:hypothetical protein [bacterium]